MISALEEAKRPMASQWEALGVPQRQGQFSGSKTLGRVPEFGCVEDSMTNTQGRSGPIRRGLIYQYVRKHPGSHIRAMARALELATGDLQYHLSWLENHGYVKTRKIGFFRHVFPAMVFNEEQESLLAVLSQRTPREVLLRILEDPSLTQGGLAMALAYSQPTVSWHMSRLVQLGIMTKKRTGRGNLYEVAADRQAVLNFLKSYHPGVWRSWSDRLGGLEGQGPALAEGRSIPALPAVVESIGSR